MRRGDYLQRLRQYGDFQRAVDAVRFSVNMKEQWRIAFDDDVGTLVILDERPLIDRAIEEAWHVAQDIYLVGICNDADIKLTVIAERMRRDHSAVAVLGGVGNGHEKWRERECLPIKTELHFARLIAHQMLDAKIKVRQRTAHGRLVEQLADGGIEAHARHHEEISMAGAPDVDTAAMAVADDVNGLLGVHWNADAARQTVAGTERDDAQRRIGSNEAGGYFIYSAVAAHGHGDVETLASCGRGYGYSISSTRGGIDNRVELCREFLQMFDDELFIATKTGNGVDNEFYFFSHSRNADHSFLIR